MVQLNLDTDKRELLRIIENKGYSSLRYSIFDDHRPREWETRIEYDEEKQVYLVYATMDRASYNKKLAFADFEEAKERFIELLDHTIVRNRYNIKNGWPVHYPSPLWDDLKE